MIGQVQSPVKTCWSWMGHAAPMAIPGGWSAAWMGWKVGQQKAMPPGTGWWSRSLCGIRFRSRWSARGTQTYDLREISISADTVLVSRHFRRVFPLATPLPTPKTVETPWPDDPRGASSLAIRPPTLPTAPMGYPVRRAAISRCMIWQDPLSRYYINRMSYDDCTEALRKSWRAMKLMQRT